VAQLGATFVNVASFSLQERTSKEESSFKKMFYEPHLIS